MDDRDVSRAILDLAGQQARTNALLEALTAEVRRGFDDGRNRFKDHGQRLHDLEHDRTRLKTGLRVSFGLGSLVAGGTLLSLYERLVIWLSQ